MEAKKPMLEAQPSADVSRAGHPSEKRPDVQKGGVSMGLFAGWVLALVLLFASPLGRLIDLSLTYDHYSHIVLVPAVALYFFIIERAPIFRRTRPSWGVGPAPTAVGAGLALWAASNQTAWGENDYLSVTILGFWLCLIGGYLTAFGTESFKKALFPLGFLLFAAPIPQAALDTMVGVLQSGSAETTHLLFLTTGIPVFRDGFYFSLPGLDVVVAPQCSGIRSSIALLITSVVAGRLFLDRNLNRLILVAFALPVTIFKNGLRIATLCYLSIYVDRGFLTGSLHNQGGHAFFVLALLLMLPMLVLLRRRERSTTSQAEAGSAP